MINVIKLSLFKRHWQKLSTCASLIRPWSRVKMPNHSIKYFLVAMATIFSLSSHATIQVFVETITEISARDGVFVVGDSLVVSNYNNGRVYNVNLDGTISTLISDNTRGPAGIRADANGNIYVAMYNASSVIRLDPQGNESVFATGILEPIGLDWDSSGNLYVSSFSGATTVTQIAPNGSKIQLAKVAPLTQVSSLCVDSADDIYVSGYDSGDIYKVTQSGEVTLFASTNVAGLAFIQYDPNKDVFYATVVSQSKLLQINRDGSTEVLIDTPTGGNQDGPVGTATIDSSIGLAVSADGTQIYFAGNTHLRRITLADPSVTQVRPYFTSNMSASVDGGTEFTHQFAFADPNNDTLMLSFDNLPTWMTFDGTDKLNGTPAPETANRTVSVVAMLSDGFDQVSQSFNLTVTGVAAPTPPAPVIPPAPAASSGGAIDIWLLVLCLPIFLWRHLKTSAAV